MDFKAVNPKREKKKYPFCPNDTNNNYLFNEVFQWFKLVLG